MKKFVLGFIFTSLTLCLFTTAALAQSTSAVTGIVTDPTGAVVNGADVKLNDPKTGFEVSAKTNDQGVYQFAKVAPAQGYILTFTAPGFETLVVTNVSLGVGVTETHNVQMTIGQVSNTVTVTAETGPTLNTTNATISNIIEERRMKELPIQIRSSPASLLGLQPGVVGSQIGTGSNRIGSVTGSRADQGNITIDGIDANDQTTGQAFATVGNAPIDAIQEFRAVTTNPGADEGRSSGGQIQLVTKSGTNDFHGSLREFNRTAYTAANSFFNNKNNIRRPQLTRNQFGGSIGGPIMKDDLFFFFDYEGRRDAQGVSYLRIVPLAHLRAGGVAYLNNVAGCPTNARLTTRPDCITVLTPAQVQARDPRGVGASPQLLSFIQSRYPLPNDFSAGNGINTAGFRFNSPSSRKENTYTTRIDWNATDKQEFFGRFNIARRNQTDTVNTVAQQFPEDPESGTIVIQDYAWVVGHTWVVTPMIANQATVGVTRQGAIFDRPFAPAFPQSFTFGAGLTAPYAGISTQDRYVFVPTIRDDLTWTKGDHSLQFGGQFKPIKQQPGLTNDLNFPTIGLGGLNAALNASLRPANIGAGATRQASFDSPFTFILGRIASLTTNYNYDTSGAAFPPGTGKTRDWRYNEYEVYAQDNWRIRNDLTIAAGMRWQYYSPPYEADGFQACNDVDLQALFDTRVRNAAAGIAGPNAEPFLRYDLCGKANNARGMYEPDFNNFAPRLSMAWNPSFKEGFMGKIFGDRKTVVRGGGSVTYDRVGGAITFIQDQVSYLFDNSATTLFGNANPTLALLNDPRFTGITTLPVANTPPAITRPLTPFVTGGFPVGNETGETNYAVDQTFRTPYSIQYSFGIQREMPGNFLFEVSYVGRQGRKLFTQADAAQILDFRDPASNQFMLTAFNNLQRQIENGSPITVQPWFENQIGSAALANYGAPCSAFGLGANCTQLVANFLGSLVEIGDTADAVQALYGNFLLHPNVGLSGQFSTNAYITNAGASSYNGMLMSLRKRFSQGFQFDLNYTFSKSIDNQSSIVNTVFGGLVCDVRNLRVCRGPSDFDVRHIVNANGIWELPFGRGKMIGGSANGWQEAIIGGWELTGIFNYRSGLAFNTTTGSFPVGFVFDSPGQLTGSVSSLQGGVHDVGNVIQFFKDPAAAAGALQNPRHGEIGNRNILRGPNLWIADMALLKNFKMPWSETHRLQIRAEAFNVFNHNNFALPNANINGTTFGNITASSTAAREFQFAFRYDF
ncbi:MAG TPA: TonB-dependent receptor [Pyrinomonadaceae bacterium]|nr:TonB-dependent receptor [Pyrinomonadaceae bacterium]